MPSLRPDRGPWWAPFTAAVGCGVLVALSVPPFGFWPLAWLGVAGVALLLPGAPLPARLRLGAGFGLGQYVIGLWWVHEFSVPGYVGLVVLSALFATAAVGVVPTGRMRTVALALPATLTLADWARDRYPLGGFPLGGISLGQAGGPLAPGLRIGGSLLLTAETAWAGVAIALGVQMLRTWRARRAAWSAGPTARRNARVATVAFALGAALAAAVPVAGWLSPDGSGGRLAPLRVGLVQGGGKRGTRAIYTDPEVVFQRHLVVSAQLRRPLDLVVWPEGVLQSHVPFQGTPDAAEVAGIAKSLDATVLVGVEQDVSNTRYTNDVVAWDPYGNIVAYYQKNHVVPFGEYVPWRSLVNSLFNLADVPFDAVPGHGPAFIPTHAAPLGIMISYEVFFDGRARSGVLAGGQVLVVPTNTASYRSTQVPTQEVAAARMRAWETGRWVLQVTPTGYTAVVAPDGRIRARSTLDQAEVVTATVPRETGRTVYVDVGDNPFALAAVLGVVAAWGLAWRGGRPAHRDRWSLRPGPE